MGKRFSGSYLFLFTFVNFLFFLLLIPLVFTEWGTHAIAKETKSIERRFALKRSLSKDGRFIAHGDGTITDTDTGLMWTKKDSFADSGKCLSWDDSVAYVSKLKTGGYSGWEMPTVKELGDLYERSKKNEMGFEFKSLRSKLPLGLDSIFADGAAYFYWASETAGPCCARFVDFSDGFVYKGLRDFCSSGGVRAVRRKSLIL